VGTLGTVKRGILAARAAGALSPGDLGVLVVGRGRRGRKRRGAGPPERWEPAPPLTKSRGAAEAAEEQASGAGAEALATRRSTEGAAHVVEAPARSAKASRSTVTPATTTAPVEPSWKRKRGFSTLR
jgi:hypothetical protein